MFYLAVTMTVTGTVAGASGSKVVPGTKKTVMPARKCYIPAIGVMAEVSLTESQESSPHGQVTRDSLLKNVSMSKPHGLSPHALVLDTAPRVESGASLQITVPTSWLVTLLLSFMLFYDILSFVACIRCLWRQSLFPG
jgi:hypothetical protein